LVHFHPGREFRLPAAQHGGPEAPRPAQGGRRNGIRAARSVRGVSPVAGAGITPAGATRSTAMPRRSERNYKSVRDLVTATGETTYAEPRRKSNRARNRHRRPPVRRGPVRQPARLRGDDRGRSVRGPSRRWPQCDPHCASFTVSSGGYGKPSFKISGGREGDGLAMAPERLNPARCRRQRTRSGSSPCGW